MAVIDGRPAMFLRDAFGGEVPLSCAYPPLELMTAAAVLREAGVSIDLLPANVLKLSHRAVAARLAAEPPDLVVIPSAWGSLDDDLQLCHRLRRALPDTRLVLSGPNVTAQPEVPLRGGDVDVVILGEPEEALLELARGTAPPDIANLAWREGGEVRRSSRILAMGFPDFPLPARDLVDLDHYTIPFVRRRPATTMATTRGCNGTCTFCPSQLWHERTVRARSVDRVLEELGELTGRYGMREVVFRDDTFTWDRDRVLDICQGIVREGLDLTWRCFATVATVDPDLLQMMSAAGCVQICYGFESGDDDILRATGKRTTVGQGRQAARWTHDAGIEVAGTFVVGLEGETTTTLERSVQFPQECELDYVQVNPAAPLPGTGFGKRQERRGLRSDPSSFRWFGARTGETLDLAPEQVAAAVRRFYRRVYFRPRYIAGRLRSRRGARALWSHAVLAARMAAFIVRPGGGGDFTS